ncbi:MFS transporter [Corynebacterium pyruviciproducens]
MNISTESPTRAHRLDRLPFTKKHQKLLFGSGIGWALDAMDVGLVSFVIASIALDWGLDKHTTSWIASIGFIGMALGAAFGGLLADKFGRRSIFSITLLVYGLATGASALATSVTALLVFRFFTGLGLGAELPVTSTLVSEFAPRHVRGRIVVLLEAFWAVGWIAAAIIGTFVVAQTPNGWRWGLAVGALPALYALYVRHSIPESVRYLELKGKTDEAEEVVRSFEESASSALEARVSAEPGEDTASAPDLTVRHGIWSSACRRRTEWPWPTPTASTNTYKPNPTHKQLDTLTEVSTITVCCTGAHCVNDVLTDVSTVMYKTAEPRCQLSTDAGHSWDHVSPLMRAFSLSPPVGYVRVFLTQRPRWCGPGVHVSIGHSRRLLHAKQQISKLPLPSPFPSALRTDSIRDVARTVLLGSHARSRGVRLGAATR